MAVFRSWYSGEASLWILASTNLWPTVNPALALLLNVSINGPKACPIGLNKKKNNFYKNITTKQNEEACMLLTKKIKNCYWYLMIMIHWQQWYNKTYVCSISSGISRINFGMPLPTKKLLTSSVKLLQLCLKRLYAPGLKTTKSFIIRYIIFREYTITK